MSPASDPNSTMNRQDERPPKPADWKWQAHDGIVRDYGSCLPCQRGEHMHCRHAQDGKQFTRNHPLGTCYCEHKKHDVPHWRGTCFAWVSGEAYSGGYRCGKKAKGTIEVTPTFGISLRNRGTVTIEVCGVHLAARKRREANDARRREERQAEDERRDEDARKKQAEEEHAARLRGMGFKVQVAKVPGGYGVAFNGEVAVAAMEQFALLCKQMEIPFEEIIEDITKGGRT